MIPKSNGLRLITNQRGQGLIEALAVSVTVIAALSALGGALYFGLVHTGMNYVLHEYLVCKKTQGTKDCKKEFHTKSRSFLWAARILALEDSQLFQKQRARLVIAMPLQRTLTLKKEIEIY